jgi:hypothetical protein
MLIFALSERYIHTYICCVHVYMYAYIITNFIEKHNSKFKTILIT